MRIIGTILAIAALAARAAKGAAAGLKRLVLGPDVELDDAWDGDRAGPWTSRRQAPKKSNRRNRHGSGKAARRRRRRQLRAHRASR